MNLRPSGYEPDELPGCSTPRYRTFCVSKNVVTSASSQNLSRLHHREAVMHTAGANCRRQFVSCKGRTIVYSVRQSFLYPKRRRAAFGDPFVIGWAVSVCDEKIYIAFSRPGSDLLSRVLRRSTIGAGAFHGRVRNGNGCSRPAMTTRSAKGNVLRSWIFYERIGSSQ